MIPPTGHRRTLGNQRRKLDDAHRCRPPTSDDKILGLDMSMEDGRGGAFGHGLTHLSEDRG